MFIKIAHGALTPPKVAIDGSRCKKNYQALDRRIKRDGKLLAALAQVEIMEDEQMKPKLKYEEGCVHVFVWRKGNQIHFSRICERR